MIRPYHLRDWRLLNRLSKCSIPLNISTALLEQVTPFQHIFLRQLWQRHQSTYVWRPRSDNIEAFVNYRTVDKGTKGQLSWLGATHPINDDRLLPLLEKLTIVMGKANIQRIVADVPEDSDQYLLLRRSGFMPYGRQAIWKLSQFDHLDQIDTVEMVRPIAEWDVDVLYTHVVPKMIRMVDPYPTFSKQGWGQYQQHDLVAYAHVERRKLGMMLHLFVSPTADIDLVAFIKGIVTRQKKIPTLPLYCTIHAHQHWLNNPLQKIGFDYISTQRLMVKHITQQVHHAVTSLEDMLAKQHAKARTLPLYGHSQLSPQHVETDKIDKINLF